MNLFAWAALAALALSSAQALVPANIERAAAYSERSRGSAVLVVQGGREIFARGQNGFDLEKPHILASGSKSFSCAIAVALVDDGRLTFDERVAETLTEWKADPRKSQATVRQLLGFTSGLPGSVGPSAVRLNRDLFGAALTEPFQAAPGERYTYGNAHLAAFGLLVKRKTGLDPAEYLQRRVLDRIGARASWQRDQAGQPNLAGSASMTARDWANYGRLALQGGVWNGARVLSSDRLAECFRGSSALAAYGLAWWLNVDAFGTLDAQDDVPRAIGANGPFAPSAPRDVVMAAGALNQRLYLLPSENAVVVRFGEGGSWSDETFLRVLLSGR